MMLRKIILICCCLVTSSQIMAWQHEVSVGYGYGKEIGQSYLNQGFTANAKLYRKKIDNTLFLTFEGTLANWHANTPHDTTLNTAALSAGLRAYFAKPEKHTIRPYLGSSIGPAYLSSSTFGEQVQGANVALQITLEGGVEVKNIDINLHLAHYCNAGIVAPNEAINIPFVLSVGYLF